MLRKSIFLIGCIISSTVLASSIQVNVHNVSGYDIYCSYTTQGDTTVNYNQNYSQCHLVNGDNAVPYVTYTSQSGNPTGVLYLNMLNPPSSSYSGGAFCVVNVSNTSVTVSNNGGSACTVSPISQGVYNVTAGYSG